MKVGKGYIKLFAYVIVLLIFIQLFRMDIIFSTDSIENIITNEYNIVKATKLSEEQKDGYNKNNFLIIYNEKNKELTNISITLDYLNIDYEMMKSTEVDRIYDDYNTIIMIEDDLNNIIDLDRIMAYVSNGGKIVYLIDSIIQEGENVTKYADSAFGITKTGMTKETNAVYFNSEVLSGVYGELNLDEFDDMKYTEFRFLELAVADDSIVHMETNNGTPLIWSIDYYEGEIMVLNLGNYEGKEFRGVLTGAISLLGEFFIYPIINSQVVFLDDFPADYNANPEILKTNYGRNTERFILDIWWPDMVKLISKYKLIYTGVYIETYNDKVSGPFENNKYILSATKRLTSDLLKYNGEIAFHGYNHQSLLFNEASANPYGYKVWENGSDIVEAINTSTSYFNHVYPNYNFTAYVPPSNLLDEDAIPSLLKAIPSIKNISGVYYTVSDDNGKILEEVFTQEFDVDEKFGTSLPRVTSGAFYNEATRYSMASALTLHGIVNHFVHPDDVQDPYRSKGLLWEELYLETDKLFGAINQYYGWLEKSKASYAAEKVKQYVNIDAFYLEEDNRITIRLDNLQHEASLILATYKDITFSNNCEYEKIDNFRYLIKMKENTAVIGVK